MAFIQAETANLVSRVLPGGRLLCRATLPQGLSTKPRLQGGDASPFDRPTGYRLPCPGGCLLFLGWRRERVGPEPGGLEQAWTSSGTWQSATAVKCGHVGASPILACAWREVIVEETARSSPVDLTAAEEACHGLTA